MRILIIACALSWVGLAQGSSGALSAYQSMMNARYLGKRVYWLHKTPNASTIPLSAVITKVIIPEINDDNIGSGNTRRIKFEVRAGEEYDFSLPQPVRSHKPRIDRSIQTDEYGQPRIRRYYDDEEGGRWSLSFHDDADAIFYYDAGNVAYTIDIEDVIQQGFLVSKQFYRHKMPDDGEGVGGIGTNTMFDGRVHFQSSSEHYAGTVIGLAPPSVDGGGWQLRVKQLSVAGDLNEPRVLDPNETLIIKDGDIVGELASPTPIVGKLMHYGYQRSALVRGRIVGIYDSDYWEFLNYERIGTDGVVEPYLYLIKDNDLTGAVAGG